MKSSVSLAGGLILLIANGAAAASCNADNCARAVTGTLRQQTSTHFADCQSYMACTVTPAPITVTSSVTFVPPVAVTTVTAGYPEKKKRVISSAVTNCPSAVPTYASACSGTARYSSACSCFGASKSTVTATPSTVTTSVTVTLPAQVSTVTSQATPPPLCNNGGLEWAYYSDFTSDDGDAAKQEAWDPEYNKPRTPGSTGSTDYVHFRCSDAGDSIYNVSSPCQYTAVEHRGYIFAPETGVYSFTVSHIDDDWYTWIGSAAYSGWTKGNSVQQNFYVRPTNTYTQNLVAGNYYPIRFAYHNGLSVGSFDFQITAPSGYTLIGSDPSSAKYTPYIVQYSCDGILAPVYPPFGQET